MMRADGGSMQDSISLEFSQKPSELRYMLGAFRRSPGLSRWRPATRFRASWARHRVEPRKVAELAASAGAPASAGVSILYPHVFGFPLHMAILTHPEFPIPIWRILQIRNRLVQHAPIAMGATIDFDVRVSAQRILARGVEIDLHTAVRSKRRLVWESLVTFYSRGLFGHAETRPASAQAPEVASHTVLHWQMPRGGAWRFGQLIGDHNGIHLSGWYARLFGFRRALYHPPVVLGHCLSRIPTPKLEDVRRLDAWLKGPVYRGATVALHVDPDHAARSCAFALMMTSETRPSLVGRITSCVPEARGSSPDAPILADGSNGAG